MNTELAVATVVVAASADVAHAALDVTPAAAAASVVLAASVVDVVAAVVVVVASAAAAVPFSVFALLSPTSLPYTPLLLNSCSVDFRSPSSSWTTSRTRAAFPPSPPHTSTRAPP